MTPIIADIPLTPEIDATVLRPMLRHDRAALTKILVMLDARLSPIDALLWLISPHPALSNKHPIWCDVDEVRALLNGATRDELLALAKIAVAKASG